MVQRTNIELDLGKVQKAKKITGFKTTKALVDFALTRLTDSDRGLTALGRLSGKIRFKKGYSYKKAR